jgi:hypothetical protein
MKINENVKISYNKIALAGYINLIEHEHLRYCQEEFSEIADRSLLIFDENHKLLADTQKTSVAIQLAKLCKEFVDMTGTPTIDNKFYRLIPWLELMVNFDVNDKNFWSAASIMISKKGATGLVREYIYYKNEMSKEEIIKYNKLVPIELGGNNSNAKNEDLREAAELSYKSNDRGILFNVMKMIDAGVLLVAKDVNHKIELKNLLIKAGVKSQDIFVYSASKRLYLTHEYVKKKKVHPYKVVILTNKEGEGSTFTYLGSFVSGVYPSNQANREQIQARIDRLGSEHKNLIYVIVHCGLLTYIMENHDKANSLSMALKDLAKKINLEE